MKYFLLILLIITSCTNKSRNPIKKFTNEKTERIKLSSEDSIQLKNYWDKAFQYGLYSTKHQQYLDSALQIKPDSAYLWQQKAMPLYKARKYSLGKPFLAKAVEHDSTRYLEYSAFMKCIFSKEYEESIGEFLKAKELFGDRYVMDHTYNFYLGLNYLQINQFEKAKEYLLKSMEQQFRDFPKDLPHEACHYLDWFYIGIAEFELENYEEAIKCFDTSLMVYENFADAFYFKASCLQKLGKKDEAWELADKAFDYAENTINEDNVFYEVYPYQVFHRLSPMARPK